MTTPLPPLLFLLVATSAACVGDIIPNNGEGDGTAFSAPPSAPAVPALAPETPVNPVNPVPSLGPQVSYFDENGDGQIDAMDSDGDGRIDVGLQLTPAMLSKILGGCRDVARVLLDRNFDGVGDALDLDCDGVADLTIDDGGGPPPPPGGGGSCSTTTAVGGTSVSISCRGQNGASVCECRRTGRSAITCQNPLPVLCAPSACCGQL